MIGSQDHHTSTSGATGAGAAGTQELKQAARQVGQTISRTAQQSGSEIQHGVSRLIDQQKSAVTSRLGDWAHSARDAAQSVSQQYPQVASLLDQAAGRVESATSYLREHEIKDLVQQVNRFGRQHPLLLLGGMFVAGALAARFIKASATQHEHDHADADNSDYASGGYGSGAMGYHQAGEFGPHGEPPFVNRNPMTSAFSGSPVLTDRGTSPVQSSAGGTLRGGLEGCEP
jgi:hypothetical protein